MAETRKLAAILAADVAGYSRLTGADEDRTLARLRALRSDLIDPTKGAGVVHVRFNSDSDRQPSKRDPSLRARKRLMRCNKTGAVLKALVRLAARRAASWPPSVKYGAVNGPL
jgi:hypothetical protein